MLGTRNQVMLNSTQENKSDFWEGCGGKTGRRKGTESPPGRKNHQSPTVMPPPLPPQPDGSVCSSPAGYGDFPPWGPFPLAADPGTAAGRVGGPSLLEAAAAQTFLGAGLRGRDKQNLNGLLEQGLE